MIVDVHGHMSAHERLYAYKGNLLAHRGSHGRGGVKVSDDELNRRGGRRRILPACRTWITSISFNRHANHLAAAVSDDA